MVVRASRQVPDDGDAANRLGENWSISAGELLVGNFQRQQLCDMLARPISPESKHVELD